MISSVHRPAVCPISEIRGISREENFNYFKLPCSAFELDCSGLWSIETAEFNCGEFELFEEAIGYGWMVNY